MPGRDRTVVTRLKADVSDYVTKMGAAAAATKALAGQIDTTNDRTAWMAQSVAALGPALVPLTAAAVPALAGLTAQMGVAALGATTVAVAFNGVGDALGTLNDYQMEPTAENLRKMQEALDKIGPSGEHLVRFLDAVGPRFTQIADTARAGLFPGVEDGIRNMLPILPRMAAVAGELGDAIGQLMRETGSGLSGDGFEPVFDYLEEKARPLLLDLGRTFGNFFDGFANMLVEMDPLVQQFSKGLLGMSRDFAAWSHSLDENQSFQEFLDYAARMAPKAMDLLGSLIDALVKIGEAASDVGIVALPVLTTLLDVIGAIASTPLGPAILAIGALAGAYGRLNALTRTLGGGAIGAVIGRGLGADKVKSAAKSVKADLESLATTWAIAGARTEKMAERQSRTYRNLATNLGGLAKAAAPGAAAIGAMGFAATGLDKKLGLTNTTMGLMLGSLAGPWGIAVGGAIGAVMDLSRAFESDLSKSIDVANEKLASGTLNLEQMVAIRDQLRQQLQAEEDELARQSERSGPKFSNSNPVDVLLGPLAGPSDEALNKTRKAFKAYDKVISDTEPIVKRQRKLAELRDAELRMSEAARASVATFADFGRAAKNAGGDLDDFLARLERQVQASLNFDRNAQKALEKGIAPEIVEELRALGPEGAVYMQQLAENADKYIGRTRDLALGLGDAARESQESLEALGDTKSTPVVRAETAAAEGRIKRVNDRLNALDKKPTKPVIEADDDPARSVIDNLIDWVNGRRATINVSANTGAVAGAITAALAGDYVTGGYTGQGDKYEPAGVVHRGEYVFSKEATTGNLAYLDGLHRALRGYADGGFVTGPVASTVSASAPVLSIDYDRLAAAVAAQAQVASSGRPSPTILRVGDREMQAFVEDVVDANTNLRKG